MNKRKRTEEGPKSFASVAQRIVQWTFNPLVVSSNLTGGTTQDWRIGCAPAFQAG